MAERKSKAPVVWFMLAQVFAIRVDRAAAGRHSPDAQDLAIAILRDQLRLAARADCLGDPLLVGEEHPRRTLTTKATHFASS